MQNFDDVERLLEGLLEGLRARRELESLRQKNLSAQNDSDGQVKTLTTEREQLNQQVERLEREREKFKRQAKNFKGTRDKLNRQVQTLMDEREQLNRQVETLTDEREQLNQQVQTLTNEREQLNRQVQTLTDEREDFKQQVKDLNECLEREREDFKRQVETLTTEREQLNRQVDDLTKKFNDADAEAKFYRETYGELDAAYELYRTLDESTRSALAGIFGAGDNATTFFSGALQETHLADFWDYAARRPENETLRRLFDFCFAAVNRGFREPPFARLNVAPGNFFDDEFMRRTSQSRQLGKVFRVFLQGYRYSAGKIIKPTIVELN